MKRLKQSRGIKVLVMVAVSIAISILAGGANEEVKNPFLADSPWPISHQDAMAQDSSNYPGLLATDSIDTDYIERFASIGAHQKQITDPISLLYSSDEKTVWGSSFFTVFVLDRSGSKLKLLDQFESPFIVNYINKDFHGSYSVLAKINGKEYFIKAKRRSIESYTLTSGHKIERVGRYIIKGGAKEERLVGLSINQSGWLVFVTNKGRVGTVSNDLSQASELVQLPGYEKLDVSNSLAVNKDNSVYIVSSQYMNRLNWDPVTHNLYLAWYTDYDNGSSSQKPGRLGIGSGSTPSLMGNDKDGYYVVITDDADVMNVDVFDCSSGEMVASTPVDFGDPSTTESQSEQSVLVRGWRAIVVNNMYVHDNPIYHGDAPMGIEQLVFDPQSHSFEPSWVVKNYSVPSGIPTMSAATNMMYALAKKKIVAPDGTEKAGPWGLVGIDWDTGKVAFFHEAGFGLKYNSAYAATEVGYDNEIISGTALGVLRFTKRDD
jgi:hypothetical protein